MGRYGMLMRSETCTPFILQDLTEGDETASVEQEKKAANPECGYTHAFPAPVCLALEIIVPSVEVEEK